MYKSQVRQKAVTYTLENTVDRSCDATGMDIYLIFQF